ncbi:TraM recognition domain-containing protein [Psychrobacillus sp. FSL H8-0484]|uniref:type IV secretory system conjugative DNA transfer family protein n=1 Tax=Psychrobacillus sp. FSL H8-0484 TaxID=2921390 RepID=UPI0030FC5E3A
MENRFRYAERRAEIFQFIRLKGHTYLATALICFNVLILFPFGLFTWFTSLTNQFTVTWLHELNWPVFLILWFLPYFTWVYTTITYPIKKGYKVILDWSKTKAGRIASITLNIGTFLIMGWAAGAKYITEHYLTYLKSVQVPEELKGYFLVDNLNSFILLLYSAPIIITGLLLFTLARHYQINKDILADQFIEWESPALARLTHPLDINNCDVIAGYDHKTKKPIVIKEDQRYLHEGIFGATGSGKTSTSILLRIVQDLIKIATGRRKMGVVFLEPKGDGVDDVLTLCKKLGIPDEKIMVIDPTKSFSIKYNPFAGPLETAAASFEGTLNALTGDQDEFFKGQQNEAAKTYTMLAKIRYGNLTNITHIQRMFTDPRYLANVVEEVRLQISNRMKEPDLSSDVRKVLVSWDGIVRYFEDEVLDYKTFRVKDEVLPILYGEDSRYPGLQVIENKKDKYVTGAKKYLNEIATNSLLSSLFVSSEGDRVFDADEFLANGGVLLVNTALAELEELSLMFGQFFIRQFQSAVFRRPKEGRIPIFLNVDEFPLYVNEAFERFLTLGRSYKVGTLIAMQSLGQLDNVVKGFKETVLSNASSKTVFGRGTVSDNKYFSEEFGEHLTVEESLNESATPMTTEKQTWGLRMNTAKKFMPRFSPTVIRELKFKHMIMQVVDENNSITISTHAIGKFVHEARFLKPYFKVKASEIKSTKEKEFELADLITDEVKFKIEAFSAPLNDMNESDENTTNDLSDMSVVGDELNTSSSETTKSLEQLSIPLDVKEEQLLPIKQSKTKYAQRNIAVSESGQINMDNLFTDLSMDKDDALKMLGRSNENDETHGIASIPSEEIDKKIEELVHVVNQVGEEEAEEFVSAAPVIQTEEEEPLAFVPINTTSDSPDDPKEESPFGDKETKVQPKEDIPIEDTLENKQAEFKPANKKPSVAVLPSVVDDI